MYQPSDTDMYCGGYISDKPPVKGLFVLTGEEGGVKNLYTERDVVYLSRGAGYAVNPGAEFILVRKTIDPNIGVEIFYGQDKMISKLGEVWTEIGRVKVKFVRESVAIAIVTQACEEVQPGDIAVPLEARPTPSAPMSGLDSFAPPSGKNEGVIAAGREFQGAVGAGNTVYLNIGNKEGVQVGQLYRIYRTYATASNDPNRKYLDQTPQVFMGMRQSYKLTQKQRSTMPRDIIGEGVVITSHGTSATLLITISAAEIFPGDQVELK